ncbi:type II toxin-antitoxin system RelE/ParE family toxin [Tabrizicola sp. TH137]|uniref:type II toxin-antitoxin system RelE/ParE family toxin n=1 Tax=Tabrizicola sp. TH137 TaxID=2067452 RepID=UPI000C7D513D|nr:type II toxin-antitoxin system RelE/ParE family toxin [Tabrizicola sp. TH137]PLL14767.1 type II toxin-antitoxin system RelE/ParE family toxin [Tabrizicola sp. TH137]
MSFRVRLYPAVADDLVAIAEMITRYAGPEAAERRLQEIEAAVMRLSEVPLKGSLRTEIAPGLRAVPAGRKAVIAFTVDEERREVLVHLIGYAGSDWIGQSTLRR